MTTTLELIAPQSQETQKEPINIDQLIEMFVAEKMDATTGTFTRPIRSATRRNWKRLLEYAQEPCVAISLSISTGVVGAEIGLNYSNLGLDPVITAALAKAGVKQTLPAIQSVGKASDRLQVLRKKVFQKSNAAFDGMYHILPEMEYNQVFQPLLEDLEEEVEKEKQVIEQEYRKDLNRIFNHIKNISAAARLSDEQTQSLLIAIKNKLPNYFQCINGLEVVCLTQRINSLKETIQSDAEAAAAYNQMIEEQVRAEDLRTEHGKNEYEKKQIREKVTIGLQQFTTALAEARKGLHQVALTDMLSLVYKFEDIGSLSRIPSASRTALAKIADLLSTLDEKENLTELFQQLESFSIDFGTISVTDENYAQKLEEFHTRIANIKNQLSTEIESVAATSTNNLPTDLAAISRILDGDDFSVF